MSETQLDSVDFASTVGLKSYHVFLHIMFQRNLLGI